KGHHLLGLTQAKRRKQNAVDQTEDRRVGVNPGVKRQDGGDSEARGAAERPKGEREILNERVEHVLLQVGRRLMSADGSARATFANGETEQSGYFGAQREDRGEVAARRSGFAIELDEDRK